MELTEFHERLRYLTNPQTGLLSIDRIRKLPDHEKTKLLYYLAKRNLPIVAELITDTGINTWLFSMGYLYKYRTLLGYNIIGNYMHFRLYGKGNTHPPAAEDITKPAAAITAQISPQPDNQISLWQPLK